MFEVMYETLLKQLAYYNTVYMDQCNDLDAIYKTAVN